MDENKLLITDSSRRYDIDWLRVILFGLLIWFHYAVFSLEQLNDSEMELFNIPLYFIITVMHQWRLAALFIISGMGTAFAFRRRTWKTYINERFIRLGIPLLFGTYILFFGVFSPIDSTIRLFSIFPGSDDMPYGHLWFIYNLLIYSVLLTPLFSHVRNNPSGKIVIFVRSIFNIRYGIGILFLPPIILSINGILFKPWEFGEVGMWWEFPRYLLYFLFGFLMISVKEDFFKVIDKIRFSITIFTPFLAIVWFLSIDEFGIPNVMEGGWMKSPQCILESGAGTLACSAYSLEAMLAAFIQSFHAWFWCLFIFSWASKLFNRPSKWLVYLNEAVYPTYIVHLHLTFLPIAIFGIIGLNYYVGLTLGTIFVMFTVMFCFEISRRAVWARPLFGIKGGFSEVKKLFPYNLIDDPTTNVIISLIFHFFTLAMIIGLWVFFLGGLSIS